MRVGGREGGKEGVMERRKGKLLVGVAVVEERGVTKRAGAAPAAEHEEKKECGGTHSHRAGLVGKK